MMDPIAEAVKAEGKYKSLLEKAIQPKREWLSNFDADDIFALDEGILYFDPSSWEEWVRVTMSNLIVYLDKLPDDMIDERVVKQIMFLRGLEIIRRLGK